MIRSSYFRKLVATISSDLVGQVISMASRFVLIPVCLTSLGPQLYGEWQIIVALTSTLLFADLGGQLYYNNQITTYASKKDYQTASIYYSTGALAFFLIGIVLCVVSIITANILPLEQFLGLKYISETQVKYIFLLVFIRILISFPIGLFFGLFTAADKQATGIMFQNIVLLTQSIATFISIKFFHNIVLATALDIFCYLPSLALAYNFYLPIVFKNNFFGFSKFNVSLLITSIRPSLHFLSLQISSLFSNQGSILIISRFLGPVEVVTYTTYRLIGNTYYRLISIYLHAIWPDLTRLYALRSYRNIYRLYTYGCRIIFISSLAFYLLVAYASRPIMHLWLNDSIPYNKTLLLLVGLLASVQALNTATQNIFLSTNNHIYISKAALLISIITVSISIPLVLQQHLTGSIVALIAAQFLYTALIFKAAAASAFNAIVRPYSFYLGFNILLFATSYFLCSL